MALEDALAKLTAAVEANTAALAKIIAGKGGAAAPGTTTAAGKPGKAPKKATEEDIRNAFGTYLSVKDKADREARKANVVKILEHFGVERATEIAENDRPKALEFVAAFEKGETPDELADAEAETGGSLV